MQRGQSSAAVILSPAGRDVPRPPRSPALLFRALAVAPRQAGSWWRRRSSGSCGLAGNLFKAGPVLFPPGPVDRRHVGVLFPQPDLSVEELADDVGVAGVAVGLGDH